MRSNEQSNNELYAVGGVVALMIAIIGLMAILAMLSGTAQAANSKGIIKSWHLVAALDNNFTMTSLGDMLHAPICMRPSAGTVMFKNKIKKMRGSVEIVRFRTWKESLEFLKTGKCIAAVLPYPIVSSKGFIDHFRIVDVLIRENEKIDFGSLVLNETKDNSEQSETYQTDTIC